jgi:VWFA-related protein
MKRRMMHAILLAITLILVGVGVVAAQDNVTVIVNDVEATPVKGEEAAYDVTAFVTVTDANGQPITDLSMGDFSVSQDGDEVELNSAAITELPITVILVIDTSGSMAADGKMAAVVDAASNFLDNLSDVDQVGLISFNDEVTVEQKPSTSIDAAGAIIRRLEAVDGAGTCLYDAAYEAISLATGAPTGRRAVLLLTDGVDETPTGEVCSEHTVDEVIEHSQGSEEARSRVPIYTIGVGTVNINPDELKDIAASTGGDALFAPSAGDVGSLFDTLSALLKNQYALNYRTETTSGQKSLTVTATTESGTGTGLRDFIVPAPPATLKLSGLDDRAILDRKREIRATAGSATIDSVVFSLDGEEIETVTEEPFAITVDPEDLEPGARTLVATATLDDGTELVAELHFSVQEIALPTEDVDSGGQAEPGFDEEPEEESFIETVPGWVFIGAGVVLLGLVGAVIFLATRRSGKKDAGVVLGGPAGAGDTFGILADAIATLTIAESMALRQGQRFDLSEKGVRLGRSTENDVIVPDGIISRNHAKLVLEGDTYRIYDEGSRFGTYVNDQKVGTDGVLLKDGDEINIRGDQGGFTRLTYALAQHLVAAPDDVTMDFSPADLEGLAPAEEATVAEPADELPKTLLDSELDDGSTIEMGDEDEASTIEMVDEDEASTIEMVDEDEASTIEMVDEDDAHTIEMVDEDEASTIEMGDDEDDFYDGRTIEMGDEDGPADLDEDRTIGID